MDVGPRRACIFSRLQPQSLPSTWSYYFVHGRVWVRSIVISGSVCSHISRITRPNFTKFSVGLRITCGRGSVLLWQQCKYVMYFRFCWWRRVLHSRTKKPETKTTRMFRPVRLVAAPIGLQKTLFNPVRYALPGGTVGEVCCLRTHLVFKDNFCHISENTKYLLYKTMRSSGRQNARCVHWICVDKKNFNFRRNARTHWRSEARSPGLAVSLGPYRDNVNS